MLATSRLSGVMLLQPLFRGCSFKGVGESSKKKKLLRSVFGNLFIFLHHLGV